MDKLLTLYVTRNQRDQIVQGLRMLADSIEVKAVESDMMSCDVSAAMLSDVDDLRDMADAIETPDE